MPGNGSIRLFFSSSRPVTIAPFAYHPPWCRSLPLFLLQQLGERSIHLRPLGLWHRPAPCPIFSQGTPEVVGESFAPLCRPSRPLLPFRVSHLGRRIYRKSPDSTVQELDFFFLCRVAKSGGRSFGTFSRFTVRNGMDLFSCLLRSPYFRHLYDLSFFRPPLTSLASK